MPPLFSIIAPTVGRLKLWQHALRSAVEQDFADFEIIAVNSQHTPESQHLIDSLQNGKIHYLTPDQTQSHLNWDMGYRAARGRYILWLDDDNYLLPQALNILAGIITTHEPDIVTGDHAHWYEPNFPQKNLQNALSMPLPLFTETSAPISAAPYLATIFGMPDSYPEVRARFHFTETAIRREFAESVVQVAGPIDFTDASPRFLQLALLASARTIWYADTPIALVIQMGESMAYQWSKKESRNSRFSVRHRFSPVSADTYNNYVTDNLLRAKSAFPKEFAPYDIVWPAFFNTYARELVFLDQGWKSMGRNFKELRDATRARKIYLRLWPYLLASIALTIFKRLRLYPLLRAVFKKQGGSGKQGVQIRLEPEVRTIRDAAKKLPEVLTKLRARH